MLYIKSMRSVVCTSESSSATSYCYWENFLVRCKRGAAAFMAIFGPLWLRFGVRVRVRFPDCERSSWMLCLEGLYQYYSRLSRPAVEVGNSELRWFLGRMSHGMVWWSRVLTLLTLNLPAKPTRGEFASNQEISELRTTIPKWEAKQSVVTQRCWSPRKIQKPP